MDNQMLGSMFPMDGAGMPEKMFPECCARIYPCVKDTVDLMSEEKISNMSREDLDRVTDEVMRKCNIHSDMPAGHSVHTMTDIVKAMIIVEINKRYEDNMYDAVPALAPHSPFPFWFYPFLWGGYGRNRRRYDGYRDGYRHDGYRRDGDRHGPPRY